ncbi:MAG: glutathione S-transferase family protein [Porticoccaceae bacterium]
MIEIYGSPVSNCYNTVLAALRFKDLMHKEFHVGASMDSSFLSRSPMGKIPYIVHAGQSISETSAIVEYLDEVTPGPALFPGDALMRARQRQLMKFVELYVESPARRLFPGVFWGQENEAVAVSEVRPVMERGLDAVDILLGDNKFFHDEPFSVADFYTFFRSHWRLWLPKSNMVGACWLIVPFSLVIWINLMVLNSLTKLLLRETEPCKRIWKRKPQKQQLKISKLQITV